MNRFGIVTLIHVIFWLAAGTHHAIASPFPKEQFYPEGKVANYFRIHDLLFVYHNPLISDLENSRKKVDELGHDRSPRKSTVADKEIDNVVEAKEAIESAFPRNDVENMICEMFRHEHEMRFDKATLRARGNGSAYWQINWNFFPTVGGFSGQPWSYLGVVNGSGEVITPEVSLWNSFPVDGDNQFIRSHFKLDKLPPAKDKKYLFGDEIAKRAKERLVKFTNKHGVKSVGNPDEKGEVKQGQLQWRLQSQRLVHLDGHADGRRVWKIEFTDECWGPEDAIELRGLALWISLTGEVSELSLGTEEIR